MHGFAKGLYRQALTGMTIRTFLSKILLPTLIAVAVSYFLLTEISRPDTPTSEQYSAFQLIKKGLEKIWGTLSQISIWALMIGFMLYALLVWTKALRFRELLQLAVSVNQLTPILALHTFWGNLLPMRSGDLSYIYLMKRREGVDESKSVASLMLASVIDLMLLLAFMVSTGWGLRSNLLGQLSYWILFVVPLLIFCALAILLSTACTAPNACVAFASYCAKPLLHFQIRPITWFVIKCLDVVYELTQVRFDWRFSKIWGYSLLGLGIRFGFQCYLACYLARDMGIHISMISLIFALAFTSIIHLLPIRFVGNLGTAEIPFVAVLALFGTPTGDAAVVAFSLHLIILLYCIPLGIYGLIKKTAPSRHEMKMSSKNPNKIP